MTTIMCADGIRHYGESQVEKFGTTRLVEQADQNRCGPHVVLWHVGDRVVVRWMGDDYEGEVVDVQRPNYRRRRTFLWVQITDEYGVTRRLGYEAKEVARA